MTAALRSLEGRPTSRGPLRLVEVRSGRFAEERDALVSVGDEATPSIRVKHFAGRPSAGIVPWIEAGFPREDERFAVEVVAALAALLPPGGHLMIAYGGDETERMLKRGIPVAVTPLGGALLAAGCTWFKDWYFAEGWREGETKLQGNKPASAAERRTQLEQLDDRIASWLERSGGDDALLARGRARAAAILGARRRGARPAAP